MCSNVTSSPTALFLCSVQSKCLLALFPSRNSFHCIMQQKQQEVKIMKQADERGTGARPHWSLRRVTEYFNLQILAIHFMPSTHTYIYISPVRLSDVSSCSLTPLVTLIGHYLHFCVKILSGSNVRSTVAAAAIRLCSRLKS